MLAWTNCGRAGDAYYRAMNEWLVTHKGVGTVDRVYNLAKIYEMALDIYITRAETLPSTLATKHDIAKGREYRSYLAGNIELLLPMIVEKRSTVSQVPSLAVMA